MELPPRESAVTRGVTEGVANDENASAENAFDEEYDILWKYTRHKDPETGRYVSSVPPCERRQQIGSTRFTFDDDSLEQAVNMEKGEYFELLCNAEIKIDGVGKDVHLVSTFEEMCLCAEIARNLRSMEFVKPLPVQKAVFSHISKGYDLLTVAPTSSGKTGAFLIPIINSIVKMKSEGVRSSGISCIVLSPAKELCMQHYKVAKKIAAATSCKLVLSVGGLSVGLGVSQLRAGCDVFFATVGRLLDLFSSGAVSLKNLKFIVIDEADKLFDDDFFEELTKGFLRHLPEDVQRLLFSATYSLNLLDLKGVVVRECVTTIQIGALHAGYSFVKQSVYEADDSLKSQLLIEIMTREYGKCGANSECRQNAGAASQPKTIVFVNTKRRCTVVACYLSLHGFKAYPLHSGLTMALRHEGLRAFERDDCNVLVSTDLGARGLDISNVSLVINYDVPLRTNWCVYVHRVGRTGRLGNVGRCITFFSPEVDSPMIDWLYDWLKNNDQIIPEFLEVAEKQLETQKERQAEEVRERVVKARTALDDHGDPPGETDPRHINIYESDCE